ncbi:hypothetical protein [Rhodococcus koreensis]
MTGILAIWNDCRQGREQVYEEWYQDEHLNERVGIEGFRIGRRYEALDASRQFLTTYEVGGTGVLTSFEYRERLAHPTPRTTAVMLDGFTNASRTVCERHVIEGAIRGSIMVTVASAETGAAATLRAAAETLPKNLGVAHSEIWLSATSDDSQPSAESALRGRDDTISGCLALEFLRQEPAQQCADQMRRDLPGADVGVYRLLCSLVKGDLV